MCLAIPMKIIEIRGENAIVEAEFHKHEINLVLLKDAKIGDYILAHGNIAIHKVAPEEAEKILKMIESLNNKNYASE